MRDNRLPRVLAATAQPIAFESDDEGWMVRDLTLTALVRLAEGQHPWFAVDLDSVEGLNADAAGARFAIHTLGAGAIVSRRPSVASYASQLGCLGLVRAFAFDSTGLRRSLEAIVPGSNVGLVVSPGIVLPYIEKAQKDLFPRPLVAHGLIGDLEHAERLLREADCVVLSAELAEVARRAQPLMTAYEPVGAAAVNPLDTDDEPI